MGLNTVPFNRDLLALNRRRTIGDLKREKGDFVSENNYIDITPDRLVNSNTNRGTLFLNSRRMKEFIDAANVVILGASEEGENSIPEIAQRIPTKNRIVNIRKALRDKTRSFVGRSESVELFFYGCDVINGTTIRVYPNSTLALTDGGGRISAMLAEFNNPDTENVFLSQDIHWQLNMDTNGDFSRMQKTFLNLNRDPKRIAKSTQLAVESGLVTTEIENGTNFGEITLSRSARKDNLHRTYVIKRLYEEIEENQTLLNLLPWGYEGGETHSDVFFGSGDAASLLTALTDTWSAFKRRHPNMTLDELVDYLRRGFENFNEIAQPLVRLIKFYNDQIEEGLAEKDIHAAHPETKIAGRFQTTLSLKSLLIVLAGLDHEVVFNQRRFKEAVQIIYNAYKEAKSEEFTSDYKQFNTNNSAFVDFYLHNEWFSRQSFNSGAANTQFVLNNLKKQINASLQAPYLRWFQKEYRQIGMKN